MKFGARANDFLGRWRSLLRGRGLAELVAPFGVHVFAVVAVGESVAGDVIPKIAGGRIIDIGLVVIEGVFIGDRALEVVGTLFAAVGNLPGLLIVIAGDGRG